MQNAHTSAQTPIPELEERAIAFTQEALKLLYSLSPIPSQTEALSEAQSTKIPITIIRRIQ